MKPAASALHHHAARGLWLLSVWGVLLFYGTFTHQPPPQTDIAGWSRYVTTSEFLIGHLVASIFGGAIGILGLIALLIVLAGRGAVRSAVWATIAGVIGSALVTSVFGIAAFAQPAIGRLYLAGQTEQAKALYFDAAQPPALVATALIGVLLLMTSMIVFGIAIVRAPGLPRLPGIGFILSGPIFFLIGAALDNFVQSVGSAIIVLSGAWLAWAANRTPA